MAASVPQTVVRPKRRGAAPRGGSAPLYRRPSGRRSRATTLLTTVSVKKNPFRGRPRSPRPPVAVHSPRRPGLCTKPSPGSPALPLGRPAPRPATPPANRNTPLTGNTRVWYHVESATTSGIPNMHILHYSRSLVSADKAETLIRAMQACAALGLRFPTKQAVKWIDGQTPEYNNTWEYWQPYALLNDGTPYLVSWARGAFGYLYRTLEIEAPAIQTIDPLAWHHGVLSRVAECNPDGRTLACAEILHEQTDPEGAYGEEILALYEKVRAAQEAGTLIYDPVKIRRRMKA